MIEPEDILSLVDKTEAEFKSLEEADSGDIFVGALESEAMSLFAEAVCSLQKELSKESAAISTAET